MNRLDKVFVAAINGNAAAGGCELALACDVRLMAEGPFTIGLTEPVLGFNPGGGGGQRLARAVGPGRAVEMLLEAHMYNPAEAVEVGLVHRVVPAGQLLDEARATAERLARRAPRMVWATKRAIYEGFSAPWPKGFELDGSGFVWSALAPSVKDAMRVMLRQIESLPADESPSPWSDPTLLRTWQDGTVAQFGD
jgi:enoyl-CoA hydratase/carnithine racemase